MRRSQRRRKDSISFSDDERNSGSQERLGEEAEGEGDAAEAEEEEDRDGFFKRREMALRNKRSEDLKSPSSW